MSKRVKIIILVIIAMVINSVSSITIYNAIQKYRYTKALEKMKKEKERPMTVDEINKMNEQVSKMIETYERILKN